MLDLVQKHVWTTCINFQTYLQNKNAFFYYCRPRRKHLICLFFFFKSNYASLFFLDLTKKNLLILLPFRKYVIFLRNRMWLCQIKSIMSSCGWNLLLFLLAVYWKRTFQALPVPYPNMNHNYVLTFLFSLVSALFFLVQEQLRIFRSFYVGASYSVWCCCHLLPGYWQMEDVCLRWLPVRGVHCENHNWEFN